MGNTNLASGFLERLIGDAAKEFFPMLELRRTDMIDQLRNTDFIARAGRLEHVHKKRERQNPLVKRTHDTLLMRSQKQFEFTKALGVCGVEPREFSQIKLDRSGRFGVSVYLTLWDAHFLPHVARACRRSSLMPAWT